MKFDFFSHLQKKRFSHSWKPTADKAREDRIITGYSEKSAQAIRDNFGHALKELSAK